METTRVRVTAPDSLRTGLKFKGTALAATQIVGILAPLNWNQRKIALQQALSAMKAAGEGINLEDWCLNR